MPPIKEDANSGHVAAAQPLDAAGNGNPRSYFHDEVQIPVYLPCKSDRPGRSKQLTDFQQGTCHH